MQISNHCLIHNSTTARLWQG